ncbi:TetR/AcrR family transcriptional regulator [Conexibacter arvalis]|uniref:AcrR family transcriptional regulator n=1 Tax=Conexibacter arvalis TaxID=912552 RepID=A0A840IAI3_9ACTN|nr:TetR/AcrR family transcriptional regulator [Conexibacter arvalis]MBB4661365.1 AcrR family transcriptional regulator [Conexibacter arvalis]
MAVPPPWTSLTSDEKRARTLAVANELFARQGIAVSMPALAEAVGAGVGSIYRQVGSKEDVIAALVIERSRVLRERFLATLEEPDPWAALAAATHATVDDCVADALTQTAWDEAAFASKAVREARAGATEALALMTERARAAGELRDDATHEDLRIVFCALRELGGIGPDAAHRLAELVLRGMRAG